MQDDNVTMQMIVPDSSDTFLDESVHAFETAASKDENVTLESFLPAKDHPQYSRVLLELVRVDLELRWRSGRPRELSEYLAAFPELRDSPHCMGEVAYEEYRQRLENGQTPDPLDYEQRFGVSTLDWPLPCQKSSVAANPLEFVLAGSDSTRGVVIPEGSTVAQIKTVVPSLSSRPVEVAALLRRHLRLISVGAVCMFGYFSVLVLLNPTQKVGLFLQNPWLLALNWTLLFSCAAIASVLWSRSPLSLRQMRCLELALIGALLSEMAAGFTSDLLIDHELRQPLAEGDHALFHYSSSWTLPFFALIVGYGALIPSTGRRCAVVVSVLAIVPLVIGLAGGIMEDGLTGPFLVSFLLQMALWIVAGAVIAAYGAHRLESLRQAASDARHLGQYRLLRKLGAGGMGEVFLAEHVLLKRPCAVKLIHPEMESDPATIRRFSREAQASASLTHPNTVQIFDYGIADDGTFYCAMEYLAGDNLEHLVSREGPLSSARAIHILRQVCGALGEAHRIGLIHRDIKPSNIIVGERGGIRDFAKLLDFGLVFWSSRPDQLTIEGIFGGTPTYASPEQATGKTVDARSDLYSLGAVAYFLLTGQPPFPGKSIQDTLLAHLNKPVVSPRAWNKEIDPLLEQAVLRCLEKDPARRFPDAASLDSVLARCPAEVNRQPKSGSTSSIETELVN